MVNYARLNPKGSKVGRNWSQSFPTLKVTHNKSGSDETHQFETSSQRLGKWKELEKTGEYSNPVFSNQKKIKEEYVHTVEDLFASAVAQRPGDFEEAFTALMSEKTAKVIESRKLDISKMLLRKHNI